MTASPPTHWPRVLVLWICGIFAAMQFSKISFAYPALQQLYGAAPAQMGLVLSTVGMVGLVFGVTVGLYAHAIGYRRLLLGGLALGAVLALLQSLVLPFPLLFATRVLEGASHLAVVVAAPTLIAANCAPQQRSVAMGLWSTFVAVAFALTAALGEGVLARDGVAGLLRWHAVGMGVSFALAGWVLRGDFAPNPGFARPPKGAEGRGSQAAFAAWDGPKSRRLWRRHDQSFLGRPGEPLAEPVREDSPWPRLASVPAYHGQIYTHLATALPGLCFFCYTGMAIALLTFLPQLAGEHKVLLAILLPLMGVAGSFCAGWLAQYWFAPLQLVRLAFAAVAVAGLALWLSALAGLGTAPAALALMFLAGVAGGSAYPLIPFLSSNHQLQAQANGAIAQMGNLGSTSGPPLFAALIAQLGVAGLVLPVVVLALLGIAVAGWGTRLHVRRAR